MKHLVTKNSNFFKKIKFKVCEKMGYVSLAIYNKFKVCSGLNSYAKNKVKEYKEQEQENKLYKEKMPRIEYNYSKLEKERNLYLSSVQLLMSEIIEINKLSKSNNCEKIFKITNKYNKERIDD